MFVALKPLAERKVTRRPGDRAPARQARAGARRQPVPAAGAGHPHRRPAEQRAVPVHAAGRRPRRAARRGRRGSARRCSKLPELADVNTDQQDKGLQTSLVIDRDTAARLGITPQMIDDDARTTPSASARSRRSTRAQPVSRGDGGGAASTGRRPTTLQRHLRQRRRPARRCRCRRSPRYAPTNTPLAVNHQGQFPSRRRSRSTWRRASSLGEATRAIERRDARRSACRRSIRGSFQGTRAGVPGVARRASRG